MEKENKPRINITNEGARSKILIDGNDVSNLVTKFNIVCEAGKAPYVDIRFLATDANFGTMAVPELPECLKPFYVLREDD